MVQSNLKSKKKKTVKIQLPRTVKTTLANFQKRALELFPDAINRIVLYGSFARGQATSESDLDILVVLNKEKQPTKTYIGGPGDVQWKELVDAGVDSMVNKGPFVSVLVVGEDVFQSEFSVSKAARKEGITLWTAQPI
jgi:predicted nucleotidyltransferase